MIRAAARVSVTVRCVSGHRLPRAPRDQLRRARPQPRARRPSRGRLPGRRVPPAPVPGRAPPGDRRRREERRDRIRLRDREGHPRPLHGELRRATTRASASRSTRATRLPSTARRSSPTAQLRSTGAASRRSRIRSSRCRGGGAEARSWRGAPNGGDKGGLRRGMRPSVGRAGDLKVGSAKFRRYIRRNFASPPVRRVQIDPQGIEGGVVRI